MYNIEISQMQGYFAIIALYNDFIVLLHSFQMKKMGIKALHFGEIDKSDFIISPLSFSIVSGYCKCILSAKIQRCHDK